MEARVEYLGRVERPRLTVVNDGAATYSALPHEILFDARLSDAAVRLYAVLQSHWWQGGECWASHTTLASQMRVKERQIRRLIRELRESGWISERARGLGQAKAYAPCQQDKNDLLNRSDMTACEPKRSKMSEQQDTGVLLKRSKMSAQYKRTEEDSLKEEAPDISGGTAERELWDYYRSKIQPAARLNAPDKIRARLKKFSVDELKAGIDKFAADPWWMDNNAARGAAWFFHSDQRSEQFLNLKPRSPTTSATAPIPRGAASKQTSKWSDFNGRYGYGSNALSKGQDDGR